MRASLPFFGIESGMRKLVVLVPGGCLVFYFQRAQLLRTLLIAKTGSKYYRFEAFTVFPHC